MARPLGMEFGGALYHVASRGDRLGDIYEDDVEQEGYLSLLAVVNETINCVCLAYCLMSNYGHLLKAKKKRARPAFL